MITLLSAACLLLSLGGCVKNYYYECNGSSNGSSSGDGTTTSKKYSIRFRANVNSERVASRVGATALQKDRFVTVYTFQNMADDIATISYETLTSGVLSPVSGTGLSLPTGKYDFYALSIANQSTYPPTVSNFETGLVGGLSNGVDYLSCILEGQTVSGATSFDLNFNHAASQIIVIIGSGASTTTVDSIYSASITPPSTTTEYIDLSTGVINPSHSLSATNMDMAITDSICQQILLPLSYSGSLSMDFQAYINGSSTPMSYTVGIPLINSQLAAGSSYTYKVLVNEDKVTIANATVNPWTEVNETGNPLTPTVD